MVDHAGRLEARYFAFRPQHSLMSRQPLSRNICFPFPKVVGLPALGGHSAPFPSRRTSPGRPPFFILHTTASAVRCAAGSIRHTGTPLSTKDSAAIIRRCCASSNHKALLSIPTFPPSLVYLFACASHESKTMKLRHSPEKLAPQAPVFLELPLEAVPAHINLQRRKPLH